MDNYMIASRLESEEHIDLMIESIREVINEINDATEQDEQSKNIDALVTARTYLRNALNELKKVR